MLSLSDAIAAIYEAASGDATWAEAGVVLRDVIGAERLYLTLPAEDGTFPNLFHEGSHYEADPLDLEYAQVYHRLNPYREAAIGVARKNNNKPRALLGPQILAPHLTLGTRYFEEFVTRHSTRSWIGATLDGTGDHLIGVFRDKTTIVCSDEDVIKVQYLLPHIKRGLELRNILARTRIPSTDRGLAVLDAMPVGAFLIDCKMRVIFANTAAEKIIADHSSGLKITNTGQANDGLALTPVSSPDNIALRMLVAATVGGSGGGAIRLRPPLAPDGRTSVIVVTVMPAPERLAGDGGGLSGKLSDRLVLVLVRNLAPPTPPSAEVLMSLFGLTAIEAQVAIGVLGGATAESVAMSRGVTANTVRRQIQDVLRKTEASNLRDLERIAAMLADITNK